MLSFLGIVPASSVGFLFEDCECFGQQPWFPDAGPRADNLCGCIRDRRAERIPGDIDIFFVYRAESVELLLDSDVVLSLKICVLREPPNVKRFR